MLFIAVQINERECIYGTWGMHSNFVVLKYFYNINISVPVKNVTLSPDSDKRVVTIVEGNIQIFSCTTVPSRPAALIQWFIGGVIVRNQTNFTTMPDEDKLISFSIFNYTGTNVDHNKTIHCEAGNIKGKDAIKSASQYISIQGK